MTAMVIDEAPRYTGPPPLVAPNPVPAAPAVSRLASATCRPGSLDLSRSGSPTPTATPGTRNNGAMTMSMSAGWAAHDGHTKNGSTSSFMFGYTPSPSDSSDSMDSAGPMPALPQHPMMYSPPGQGRRMSNGRDDKTPPAPAHSVPGSTARRSPIPVRPAGLRRGSMSRSAFGTTTASSLSTPAQLTAHFRSYLRILNQRLPSALGTYLAPRVSLNGRRMSAESFATTAIPPGGTLSAEFVVADIAKRLLAARIEIEIPSNSPTSSPITSSPNLKDSNLGLNLDGQPQPQTPSVFPEEQRRGSGSSTEHVHSHVFYHFDENWRIDEIWSIGEAGSGCAGTGPDRPPKCSRAPRRRPSIPSVFESYRM